MRRWMDRGRGRASEAGAGRLVEGSPAGAVGSPGSVKVIWISRNDPNGLLSVLVLLCTDHEYFAS